MRAAVGAQAGYDLASCDLATGPLLAAARAGYNGSTCAPRCAAGYRGAAPAATCNGTWRGDGHFDLSGCHACEAGTRSAAGASECATCAAGTWSAAASSRCAKCPPGTWSARQGAGNRSNCTPCAAGLYSAVLNPP